MLLATVTGTTEQRAPSLSSIPFAPLTSLEGIFHLPYLPFASVVVQRTVFVCQTKEANEKKAIGLDGSRQFAGAAHLHLTKDICTSDCVIAPMNNGRHPKPKDRNTCTPHCAPHLLSAEEREHTERGSSTNSFWLLQLPRRRSYFSCCRWQASTVAVCVPRTNDESSSKIRIISDFMHRTPNSISWDAEFRTAETNV